VALRRFLTQVVLHLHKRHFDGLPPARRRHGKILSAGEATIIARAAAEGAFRVVELLDLLVFGDGAPRIISSRPTS
jgi:hypothetical protein